MSHRVFIESSGRRLRAVFTVLALVAIAATLAVPAGAQEFEPVPDPVATGGVSGTVTSTTGGPIEGVRVCAFGGSMCAVTAADGSYVLDGLPAENVDFPGLPSLVTLEFDGSFVSHTVSGPAIVVIEPNRVVPGVDAVLAPAGIITGVVTSTDAHLGPLEGVRVCAVRCATTDASGFYEILGVPADEIVVLHVSGSEVGHVGTLQTVQLAAGEILRHDVALEPSPGRKGVAGNVSSPLAGPVPFALVCVIYLAPVLPTPPGTEPEPPEHPSATTCVNADEHGNYVVWPLLSWGSHTVEVREPAFEGALRSVFLPEFDTGVLGGVDFVLEPLGGAISGTVTSTLGAPVHRAQICAFRPQSPAPTGCGWTDASGAYTLVLPGTGDHFVVFDGRHIDFDFEFFDGAIVLEEGTLYPTDAELVSVALGEVTSGIDGVLAPDGHTGAIAGTVSGALGEPVGGVDVCAHPYLGQPSLWTVDGGCATSTDDGTYEIDGLARAAYRVEFSGVGAGYTDDVYDAGAHVLVAAGATTGDIDAVLHSTASIEGVVSGAEGEGVAAVVAAYAPDDGFAPTKSTTADADGAYRLDGLPPGPYSLAFIPPEGSSWATRWFGGATSRAGAQTVVVSPDTPNVEGIDHELSTKASLAGVVTSAGDGTPVEGATVTLYAPEDGAWSFLSAETAPDGSYHFSSLAPGNYHAVFRPPAGTWLTSAWFDGSADREHATTITITEGGTHVADAALGSAGRITGAATVAGTDAPAVGTRVFVYAPSDRFAPSFWTTVADDGTYVVDNVRPGTYKVYFVTPEGLARQWFGGPTRAAATDLEVQPLGAAVVDAQLAQA